MGKSKYMFLPAWFCEASCKYKTQGIGEDLISLQCTSYELMVRAMVCPKVRAFIAPFYVLDSDTC